MSSFAIVTDSAADISPEVAHALGIRVVPLHIVAGGRDYRDGIDLTPQACARLLRGKDPVQVAQPTVADFVRAYTELVDEGYTEILSVHVGSEFLPVAACARAVARNMPSAIRVEVLDSCGATVGEGVLALQAAAMAHAGMSLSQALERVRKLRDACRLLIVPGSLDTLMRLGCVPASQGWASSLFDIKVLLEFDAAGELNVLYRTHGVRNVMAYLVRRLARRSQTEGTLVFYKLHAGDAPALRVLEKPLETNEIEGECAGVVGVGALMSSFVGEGAVGVLSYPAALHTSLPQGINNPFEPGLRSPAQCG